MTMGELRDSVRRVFSYELPSGTEPFFLSRFTDTSRLAAEYRRGRVFSQEMPRTLTCPLEGQASTPGSTTH